MAFKTFVFILLPASNLLSNPVQSVLRKVKKKKKKKPTKNVRVRLKHSDTEYQLNEQPAEL